VAELYWGTTSAFVERTKRNEIAGRLTQAFFDSYGWMPPDSEVCTWRNSLRALCNAIELGGLLDHGLLLEYELPLTSRRLDAMITGHDRDGRPAAGSGCCARCGRGGTGRTRSCWTTPRR